LQEFYRNKPVVRPAKCAFLAALVAILMECLLLFLVSVKWGKEKFDDVQCNTDEPPLVFKATLFSLSGVQPDRQKIMFKGVVIKVCFLNFIP
jgi:hypothetical protein